MKKISVKLLVAILMLCMAASVTAFAAGINYMSKVCVAYTHIDYAAGEEPRTAASVTEGECTVAYEYWREIEQKEEGGVWSGTGRYWYSDPDKMASLSEDKRITKFEAGKDYSYNIVLSANRGSFFSDEETVVSVGEYEWGTPGRSTNLEIKNMSTTLYIYSPYSIHIPQESDSKVITDVEIVNVNINLDASTPVEFTAKSVGQYDIVEEAWEAGGAQNNDIIKSTDAPRAPIKGIEYWYSIVLRAKDGYEFSKDFSDSKNRIKEGNTFSLNGVMYESRFSVSSDGKTLTAWEFMNPVAVNASEYKIIEGANGTWTQNTDKTLTFRANGDFSAFSEVKVDGNTVSAENYTAVSGSTVITLKKEYLNTLSEGKHTLTVVYNDGNCSTEFEIKNKSPETGDSNNYFMWLVLVFVCVCAAGGTLYFVKKKNTVKQAE